MQKLFLLPVRRISFFSYGAGSASRGAEDAVFWKSQYPILPPSFHRDLTSLKDNADMSPSKCSGVKYLEFITQGRGS